MGGNEEDKDELSGKDSTPTASPVPEGDSSGSNDGGGASPRANRDPDVSRASNASSRSSSGRADPARSPLETPDAHQRSLSGSPAQFTRSHSRAQQQKMQQQQQQSQHHVAPHIVNSRPPSAASNSSGGGPPRTTTSRRGGRSRCRSPPNNLMANGGPGGTNAAGDGRRGSEARGSPGGNMQHGSGADFSESYPNGPPASPANPSAAAAAAAAAAKSLSSGNPSSGGGPPPSSWYGGDPSRYPHSSRLGPSHHPHAHSYQQPPGGHHPHHRPPSSQQHYPPMAQQPGRYDRDAHSTASSSTHHPPRNWSSPSRNRGGGGGVPGGYRPMDDQYGYRGSGGDYRGTPSPYPGDRRDHRDDGSSVGYHPSYENSGHYDYKRRYGDPQQHYHHQQHPQYQSQDDRSVSSSRRGAVNSPIPPPSGAPPGYYGVDPYMHGHHPQHGLSPSHRRDPNDPYYNNNYNKQQSQQSRGGTTRVIGTATPIHIARGGGSTNEGSKRGDIFRPKDEKDTAKSKGVGEDSPEKVLLSLRTPTTSFDNGNPSSPDNGTTRQQGSSGMGETTTLLFDQQQPHRSPRAQQVGQPAGSGPIEMASSFTLFNQSFDSFGDSAQYFSGPLDSTLQTTSFGVGPTASMVDPEQLLKAGSTAENELLINRSMSGGIYTQQLLAGSGSGGAFTFGMSPNNSFGGGAQASLTSPKPGSTMVLRSSASNEMLGMYQSYSGGAGGISPQLNKTLLQTGSFGGPALSQNYSRSFANDQQYATNPYSGPPPARNDDSDGDGKSPRFYAFLRRHRAAFKECTFLLPGLKAALLEAPTVTDSKPEATVGDGEGTKTEDGGKKMDTVPDNPHSSASNPTEPSPQDLAVALRRVASAVCAFGGTIVGDRASVPPPQSKPNSQSIFREKDGDTATVTPTPSTSSAPASRYQSRQRLKYDEALPARYYENDNRLSWEFEENPPVEDLVRGDSVGGGDGHDGRRKGDDEDNEDGGNIGKQSGGDNMKGEDGKDKDEGEDGEKKDSSSSSQSDQPKMRYRCKLCGQPKQNHTCIYQQSLARSIGIMVYPALNAYTSAEPGYYAPNLADMNNFVLSGGESVSSTEGSPSRPTPDHPRRINPSTPGGPVPNQVTPETLRGSSRGASSPMSSMSVTGAVTPQRNRSSGSISMTPGSSRKRRHPSSPGSSSRKRRPRMYAGEHEELLFVESMEIRPEQYRLVSNMRAISHPDAFTYPALPLPYAQRERLSDNLFSLSKQVSHLTEECAAVLRQARRSKTDQWDLAVAELMTQVVVVVKCHENDSRFDGLQQYLLWLGIAC